MCRAITVFFRHATDGIEFGGKANAEHDSAFRFEGQHSSTLNGCWLRSRMRKTDPNRKFTHVAIGLAKCNNRSLPESAESLGLQAGEYVDAPVATTHRLTFPAFRRRFVSDLLHQPSIGLDDFCFADLDAFEI